MRGGIFGAAEWKFISWSMVMTPDPTGATLRQ
jgi:hypothetical protein